MLPGALKGEGTDKVIDPAPPVTVIWLAVPVRLATTGATPVLPISNWPFVGAVVVARALEVPEYRKLLAVTPDTVSPANVGVAAVCILCGVDRVIDPAPFVTTI
jgi:hypothetical protein